MNKGYIKLYRQIQDNPLWFCEPFSKAQAWIDLLLMASYENAKRITNGKEEIVKRGVVVHSIRYFASRWKWSEKSVRCFFDYLLKHEMIKKTVSHRKTHIEILNYDKHQSELLEGHNKGHNEGHKKSQYLQGLEGNEGHMRGTTKGTTKGTTELSNNKPLEVMRGTSKGTTRGTESKEIKNINSVCIEPTTESKKYFTNEQYNNLVSEYGKSETDRRIKEMLNWEKKRETIIDDPLKLFCQWNVQYNPRTNVKPNKTIGSGSKNNFNNFSQRDYDFDALERKLLSGNR